LILSLFKLVLQSKIKTANDFLYYLVLYIRAAQISLRWTAVLQVNYSTLDLEALRFVPLWMIQVFEMIMTFRATFKVYEWNEIL